MMRRKVGVIVVVCGSPRVAMSLLELPGVCRADADTPASHEMERDFVHAGLA